MKLYCVSHQAPIFELGHPYTMVSPRLDSHPDGIVVADDYFGPRFDGGILAEYTQLFGLHEHLKKHAMASDRIGIFQYRKFLGFRAPPALAQNITYSYPAPAQEAASLFPTQAEFDALGEKSFITPLVKFKETLARAYAISHEIEDFVCFALALRELPGFDQARCDRFINCEFLMPTPSLGVFRVGDFNETMLTLWQAWDIFSRHYLKKRDAYQRRVGGFLLERLHSFLLFERYVQDKTQPVQFGSQIIVSETPFIKPG